MKKISMMMMVLLAAVTMSAETNKVDTLTATSFGIPTGAKSYASFSATGKSGAEYAVYAYGQQKYIQIKLKDNVSGFVVTKSAGYVKKVSAVITSGKNPGLSVFAANTAYTSPSDLYSSKANKVGIIAAATDVYTFTKNYQYVGLTPSENYSRYIDTIFVEWGTEKIPGGDPTEWIPDTISVTQARALIDSADVHTHYVKGIVSQAPFIPEMSGYVYSFYMVDYENKEDSLEAFTVYKADGSKFASIEEMQDSISLGDTVLIFANGLGKYKQIYETTSCKYIKTLGKSSALNANSIFKYPVGAVQLGMAYDSVRYKYELVISKAGTEAPGNALHMIINSANELGIAGSYNIRNYKPDSSYVDGEGPVTGSLKLTYVEEDGLLNKYTVKADFSVGGLLYRMDTTFSLAGWDPEYTDQFKLSDDVPYIPQEGDTLTCAQAKKYALEVLAAGAESSVFVYVIGYANNSGDVKEGQQTFYMDDQAGSTKTVQSFWGNLITPLKVTNGSKVQVYGKLMHYAKDSYSTAEIKNGDVTVLEGGQKFDRGIVTEEIPEGAITVAEAKALADQLAVGDTSSVVIVKGYVVDLYKSFNTQYKTQSFYMNDDLLIGEKSHFETFRTALAAAAMVGDFVFVEGRLTRYVGESYTTYTLIDGTGHFASLSTSLAEIVEALPQTKAQKLFFNGNIYIVREGVVYNLQGNVIR